MQDSLPPGVREYRVPPCSQKQNKAVTFVSWWGLKT